MNDFQSSHINSSSINFLKIISSPPTIHAKIKVTSEIDVKLEIPFRSANPASIYQIMHTKAKAIITLNKKETPINNNSNNDINQNNNYNPPVQTVVTSSILTKSLKDNFKRQTAFH